MTNSPYAVALDLTCAYDEPRTGVTYAAIQQACALAQLENAPRLHGFATPPGSAARSVPEFEGLFVRNRVIRRAGRIKRYLWSAFEAPSIEMFTGRVDIAHGLFHLLPVTKHAKRVVTIHDLSFLIYPDFHTANTIRAHTAMVRNAVKHADAIVTVSESVRREVLDHFPGLPPDRVHAVHNGVDYEKYAVPAPEERIEALLEEYGLTRGEYFFYVGTIEPRKNLVRFIDAFELARDESGHKDKLVIVGKEGWKSAAIMADIKEAAEKSGVVYPGRLPRSDVAALMQVARACVYPSVYEGFGLPVIEAMAAGAPILTSDIPVIREVGGDYAQYVSPHDTVAIAGALINIMDDGPPDSAAQEARRAHARSFSWQRSAEALVKVYEGLLAG